MYWLLEKCLVKPLCRVRPHAAHGSDATSSHDKSRLVRGLSGRVGKA